MRIDRMLAITVMLLNRERISAKELADKFEVSVRTIYRDIDAINMAGIPIIAYPGNNGGFGIMENYKLDHQLLTLKDMGNILTALKGINTTLEDIELESAIEKISNLVPEDKTKQIETHLEQFVIDILPWGYSGKRKQLLKSIYNSIIKCRQVKFSYRNAKGEFAERTVEPMTLLFKGYTWYLFSYCKLRNDFRMFRLSRMRNFDVLEEEFERKEQSYETVENTNNEKIELTHLKLKFKPEVRVRVDDFFDEDYITVQENGDLIVDISFPEDDWVYSFILGYGDNVEVLEPPHIREIIREKAKKILETYQT